MMPRNAAGIAKESPYVRWATIAPPQYAEANKTPSIDDFGIINITPQKIEITLIGKRSFKRPALYNPSIISSAPTLINFKNPAKKRIVPENINIERPIKLNLHIKMDNFLNGDTGTTVIFISIQRTYNLW